LPERSPDTDDRKALKADLRRAALGRRAAIEAAGRDAAVATLAARAAELGPVAGKIVSGFWPIRDEINPRPLMAALAALGAELALPAVVDRETIVFRRWREGEPLVAGGFGTLAPGADAETVDPDVMLVPLAAFDVAMQRIGYGAGHYDRAIDRLQKAGRRPRLIGVAFSCQEVPQIPAEPHDEPLDMVLTENGIVAPAAT